MNYLILSIYIGVPIIAVASLIFLAVSQFREFKVKPVSKTKEEQLIKIAAYDLEVYRHLQGHYPETQAELEEYFKADELSHASLKDVVFGYSLVDNDNFVITLQEWQKRFLRKQQQFAAYGKYGTRPMVREITR